VLDLGCGRGFLANILSLEGVPVRAVDAQAHPSWSLYDAMNAPLVLEARELSVETLTELVVSETQSAALLKEPQVLWLVGNRSDELTPWLLWVLAWLTVSSSSSSSVQCFLLLLPCCAWDFGARYRGSYMDYMRYLQKESVALGLTCERGVLSELASEKNVVMRMSGGALKSEGELLRVRLACTQRRQRVAGDGIILTAKKESGKYHEGVSNGGY
jgi:hypothetical protein